MQKVWALDELIINDEINLRSILTGGVGLPQVTAKLAGRYGRWPVLSGLDRPGSRWTLKTLFKHATPAARYAARRALLQYLNPELETARRLVATDAIIEGVGRDGMLLALGPWDIYQDNDGDWHARDLLRPDTMEADITALGDFADGRGTYTRGIEVTGTTEISLDDEVSVISGENALSFRIVAQMPYAHDGGSWPQAHNWLWDARGASDSHRVGLYYDTADDKFKFYANGGDRLESAAQTFDADDWVEIVVTLDFDSNAYKLYIAGGVVDTDSTALTAPTLTAWQVGADYAGANLGDFIIQEYQVAGVVLTAAAVGKISGKDTRARWLDVLCEVAQPWMPRGTPSDRGVVAALVVDGDVRWRSRDGDVHVWDVASGAVDATVTVDSDDDVYPVLRLTPKQAKTAGYAYRRWVPVIWTVDEAYADYPYMIGTFDTAALVTASRAQVDGDDWRVMVDGVEKDRWFGDSGTSQFNQTATKTWINLSFQAGWEGTLEAAIGSGDTVDSIDVNEDISAAASAGILVIYHGASYEAFTYTGKNDTEKRFTGVSRAAKGTSALALSASDSVYWVQHDVWVLYGNASVSAPSQDDDYKPVFDLGDSTNTSWVYEEFGEDDGLRTGAWSTFLDQGNTVFYTGVNTSTDPPWDQTLPNTDPWENMGICPPDSMSIGSWQMYNPCGITNVNVTGGRKFGYYSEGWYGKIRSSDGISWIDEYSIPAPSVAATWEAWTRNEAITSGKKYIAFRSDAYDLLEVADCTVTLNSSNTPTHEVGSELGNYSLDCVIENETTGDGIALNIVMGLDETLEVDTDSKTVTLLEDGSGQQQAFTPVSGARRDWLRLVDGENELSFTDTGTVELEIVLVWDRRLFE